jgi:hypothetical protein
VISEIAIGSLVSSTDKTSLDEDILGSIAKPIDVSLRFGFILEPSFSASKAKPMTIEHNYMLTGNTVTIIGNVIGVQLEFTNTDEGDYFIRGRRYYYYYYYSQCKKTIFQ